MARKAKVIESDDDRTKLIAALAFASLATNREEGRQQFVSIRDQWLTAQNDTFAIGVHVDVNLELSPQAAQFEAALKQCGPQFQLTQVDLTAVSIKSGAFRALVPALSGDEMNAAVPDPIAGVIDERVKEAFAAALRIKPGKTQRIFEHSIMLGAGSVMSTNGVAAIEYWHGAYMPQPFLIPRKTAEMIAECTKKLVGIGASDSSITFHFDDMSFVKSQLTAGAWVNLTELFDKHTRPTFPLWEPFHAGMKAISAFVENDVVHFHADHLATHHTLDMGASYRVEGIPPGYKYAPSLWKSVEPLALEIGLGKPDQPCLFTGRNCRGLIMGKAA